MLRFPQPNVHHSYPCSGSVPGELLRDEFGRPAVFLRWGHENMACPPGHLSSPGARIGYVLATFPLPAFAGRPAGTWAAPAERPKWESNLRPCGACESPAEAVAVAALLAAFEEVGENA